MTEEFDPKRHFKMSIFRSFSFHEIAKVVDKMKEIGYEAELADNGNIVFTKKEALK